MKRIAKNFVTAFYFVSFIYHCLAAIVHESAHFAMYLIARLFGSPIILVSVKFLTFPQYLAGEGSASLIFYMVADKNWKFVCPVCEHVQSCNDFEEIGKDRSHAMFNCIGRFKKSVGCDYTMGGLFTLNKTVIVKDFLAHKVFEMAESGD